MSNARTYIAILCSAAILMFPSIGGAIVAPFSLNEDVPLLRQLLGIILIASPFMLGVAGLSAAYILIPKRTVNPRFCLALVLIATIANAVFWLQL